MVHYIVTNPVDALVKACEIIQMIGHGIGIVAYEIGNFCYLAVTDRDAAQEKIANFYEMASAILTELLNTLTNTPPPTYIRFATQIFLDWKLSAKIFAGLGKLYQKAKDNIKKIKKLSNIKNLLPKPSKYLSTAEGITIKADNTSLFSQSKGIAGAQKKSQLTSQAAKETKHIPHKPSNSRPVPLKHGRRASTNTPRKEVTYSTPNQSSHTKRKGKPKGKNHNVEKSKTKSLHKAEVIDPHTLALFTTKGYGPSKDKTIKIRYQHILQPDMKVTKNGTIRPSGWHHDLNGNIQRTRRHMGKIIEFDPTKSKAKGTNGTFKLYWRYANEGTGFKPSTFFPSEWSRETVQKKIIEAYDYCKKNKIVHKIDSPTGNYILEGYTMCSVPVNIIIKPTNEAFETIITAHPIIKKVKL